MVHSVTTSTSGPPTAPETSPGAAHPDHHPHMRMEDRLEKAESRADDFSLVLIFLLGAAMAIGLATATGHVSW